jgi:cytochrome c biogenesis protein CcdA
VPNILTSAVVLPVKSSLAARPIGKPQENCPLNICPSRLSTEEDDRGDASALRGERSSRRALSVRARNNGAVFRLIALVVSIGLADSLNPSTIVPSLYVAAGERRGRELMQFTLGVFAVYFVYGAAIVLGPGQVLLALVPHPGPTVRYILETVAGAVMLIAAGLLWLDRGSLAHRELPAPPAEGKSSALLGVTITGVELPTAFPYFAAIAAIVGSGYGPGGQLLLLLLYNLCFVLPLIVIIVTITVAGDEAERILARTRDLLQQRWPALLAGVALIAGVFVTLLGVTGLVSGGHGSVASISRRVRRILSH